MSSCLYGIPKPLNICKDSSNYLNFRVYVLWQVLGFVISRINYLDEIKH